LLTEKGEIFSFGENFQGQVGVSNPVYSDQKTFIEAPTPVEGLEGLKFNKIFSKGNHNFAVTDQKELFGWGDNSSGQVNGIQIPKQKISGKHGAVVKPHSLNTTLRSLKCNLHSIAMGQYFSLLQCYDTDTGNQTIWGIGSGTERQLGPQVAGIAFEWTEVTGFGNPVTQQNGLQHLRKLQCGNDHCIVVGSNPGEFWTWGSNEAGQLGSTSHLRDPKPSTPEAFRKAVIDDAFADGDITIVYSASKPVHLRFQANSKAVPRTIG
jgi:alpha-tubulin suppressor-like RCC1 family protein